MPTSTASGLTKRERQLQGPQGSAIRVQDRDVVNFCANNYLGLANHPAIVAAAHEGLDRYGYGMASVRFICGTQDIHKKLEADLARFLGKDDAILYSSCWDANGGLFETILDRRGRDPLRRAESRQHHRRRPPLQGEALPLQESRPGRARKAS